ncbi:aminotransferase class V-fold PLP-dependent enzyme [Nocardioides panacisoli]|uniref:Cyclic nucleotide-binding domain-containing protein n=1 Tax=Nocardioides panacisoli TaxID=627624 RepID=A0ABP7IR06_9ACTN
MTGSPFNPEGDPLALDRETMRALGHATVDAVVDMLVDPSTPCLRRATPEEMAERLPGDLPESGAPLEDLLGILRQDVFPFMSRLDHPGYFAFIPACGTFPSALGDFIGAVLNPYVGSWMEAAGPTRLELVVLDWFKEWIGYPPSAAGILVSGGSAANMTALACARESLMGSMSDDAVLYVGDQAHSSLARAARLLGFRPEQVRVLLTDERQKLSPAHLAAAIDADVAAGRRPLFVAAAGGSTNTGAVDPLPELAQVCHDRGAWLHVDGAYGGFAALTDRGRRALAGIELADSVTLDPHKWLYQPMECGSVLVRDGHLLRRAFEIAPDYLKDSVVEGGEVNFADRGLQLSRGSRALKVWMSLRFFGATAFREAVDRSLDLALLAEEHVRSRPELELMSPASLGIIAFRRRAEDEPTAAAVNARLVAEFERTGRGLVSSTRLHGRYAVRLCAMNHTSAAEHVREVLDFFATAALPDQRVAAEVPSRDATIDREAWLRERSSVDLAAVADVPLFADLEPTALERVVELGRQVLVPEGGTVVRRWETSRDLYVVLAGAVVATRGDRPVARFGPGTHFGEFAALDWGAGYGYARQATVTAEEPSRLLALSPGALAELIGARPELDRRLRSVVRERLADAEADA